MDTVGPLPTTPSGYKYIIVMMDWFSKFPHAVAVKDNTAESVIAVLAEWISWFGEPSQILTDRGSNYTSTSMVNFCRQRNILLTHTTSYHPQSNGLVERFNRSLQQILAMWVSSVLNDWRPLIPYALQCYRVSRHSTTKKSPIEILFGFSPSSDAPAPTELERYSAWYAVRETIIEKQKQSAKYYNRKVSKMEKFASGDLISIWFPPLKRLDGKITTKLLPPLRGPFRIKNVSDYGVITFETVGQTTLLPTLPSYRVHVNRCVKFVARPNEYLADAELRMQTLSSHRPEFDGFKEWSESTYNGDTAALAKDWESSPTQVRDLTTTNEEPPKEIVERVELPPPPSPSPSPSPIVPSSSMDISETTEQATLDTGAPAVISFDSPQIRHPLTWKTINEWKAKLENSSSKSLHSLVESWSKKLTRVNNYDGFTVSEVNVLLNWLKDHAQSTLRDKTNFLISHFHELQLLINVNAPTLPSTSVFLRERRGRRN